MKSIYLLVLALGLNSAIAFASTNDAADHAKHHPESATVKKVPQKAPQASTNNAPAAQSRQKQMDAQMKTMRDMHEKMMNAKAPEERRALMDEHMKAMQGGMSMMQGMMGGGMSNKKMLSQQEMQQQMEMMQMMMQMMMDRMGPPPAPAK